MKRQSASDTRQERQVASAPWDTPMYTPADAGRLVQLHPDRVRRWLRGYGYTYTAGKKAELRHGHKEPVVKRVDDESPYATFLDLIDLLFVKKFLEHGKALKHGISLQKLRKALKEAEELIGGHHFAQRSFFTDGSDIYLQVQEKGEFLLELLSGGQWVIAPVILAIAHQIDFHDATGFAERWYPLGRENLVVLDPAIAFGAPTIVEHGVKTANLYDLFKGEGDRTEPVATWMDLSVEEVGAAVRFEEQLRAA